MNDTFTSLPPDQDLTSSTVHQVSNTASTVGIKKHPVLYIEVHESIISVLSNKEAVQNETYSNAKK